MSLKILKKIRLMVAGVAIVSLMTSVSVFADGYNGRLIVPRSGGNPEFFIKRVDITNNQLEFALLPEVLNEKMVSRIGAGWVADRSIMHYDVRAHSFGNPGIQTVFLSGDEGVEKYISSKEGDLYKTFTVDAIIDLRHNLFKDFFYMVEFTDGEVWMNQMAYAECGESWTMGKSCDFAYFTDSDIDNVVYKLVDAPEKFVGKIEVEEPVKPDEPLETPDESSDDIEKPDVSAEPVVPDESSDVLEKNDSAKVENPEPDKIVENREELPALVANVASIVKYSTDVTSADVVSTEVDGDDIVDEDSAITETNEDRKEVSLDVPVLGKNVTCEEFNFWPYLIIGFGGGIFLFLVLSYIKKGKHSLL